MSLNTLEINQEELEEQLIEETKADLNDMEKEIHIKSRIEQLWEDPAVQSWLNKIFNKSLESHIEAFRTRYNESPKFWVENVTRMFLLYHPDLIPFICWELWLPTIMDIRELNKVEKTKFDSLTLDQKFKFMCISEVLSDYIAKWWNYWERIKQDSAENIINKYYKYAQIYTDSMTENLNERIKERTTAGYIILAWMLREEYGLTRKESEQVAKYLEEIADPEKTKELKRWWGELISNYATTPLLVIIEVTKEWWKKIWWWALLVALIIWVALWVGWTLYVQNIWKPSPTQMEVIWTPTEITGFQEVFEIVSGYAKTDSNTQKFEEPGLWYYDETTWTWIERASKRGLNRAVDLGNLVESRSLKLQLRTEVWYHFDMTTARCYVTKNKDWKWIFHFYVKNPKLQIDKEQAQISDSKREWFNLDKFDDYELKCIEELRTRALEAANNPKDIEKAKEAFRNNLLSLFKSVWYADSNIIIKKEDVEDVIITYNIEFPSSEMLYQWQH